jgi:L-serine deaminase
MHTTLNVIGNHERGCSGCNTSSCGTCAPPVAKSRRRVDLDTTISAMALTAKEMNTKYKETSEGGLAVSAVLC